MLGGVCCRIEHIFIEDIGMDGAGLSSAPNLHRNIGSAKDQTFLAPFQLSAQLFLGDCAGIHGAQQCCDRFAQ
jgi:hypothetical protein